MVTSSAKCWDLQLAFSTLHSVINSCPVHAVKDHVPRIYPPTSTLVVGLHLAPYSDASIVLSVTTSLRSSKQSVEVGVYLRWFGRFCLSRVRHCREKRITEFTYTESSTHWNQLYVKPRYYFKLFTLLYFQAKCGQSPHTFVARLVEALLYKPKYRGFDSRWCRSFSLTVALGLTHTLTEIGTGNISWG